MSLGQRDEACLLACIQRNNAFGKQEDSNCTSNDLLDVTSDDCNFNHDPHQQSGGPGILGPATTSHWLQSVQTGAPGINMCIWRHAMQCLCDKHFQRLLNIMT